MHNFCCTMLPSFWVILVGFSTALGQQAPRYALVLDKYIYSLIQSDCQRQYSNGDYPEFVSTVNYSDYFQLAPSYLPTPTNASTAFLLTQYIESHGSKYAAVVSTYNPYITAISLSFNLLYYIYDYNFNPALNMQLELLNETGYQMQTSLLNSNVRVVFSYYNLYQVSYQMAMNFNNDPVLKNYAQSSLQFILCDSSSDAGPAVAGTSGKTVTPIVLALDQYIDNDAIIKSCGTGLCKNNVSCSISCAIHNLVLTIRQGLNAFSSTATVLIVMSQATQLKYLKLILEDASDLGLLSNQVLWILTQLWISTSDLMEFIGLQSAFFVVSVPSLESPVLKTYICTDYAIQLFYANTTQDNLPCSLSNFPSDDCDDLSDTSNPWALYTGFLPTNLQYNVRRLTYISEVFFAYKFGNEDSFANNSLSLLNRLPTSLYQLPALPLQAATSKSNQTSSGNITWAPYPNNCNKSTIFLPYVTATTGSALLSAKTLTKLAVNAAAFVYEPLVMRKPDYDTRKQALIVKTLSQHNAIISAIVYYSDNCDDSNDWCFYNASAFGFPDPSYYNTLANATSLAGGQSFTLCPLSLMIPFMDNTDLYTGFSIDLLNALKKEGNFSVNIEELGHDEPSLLAAISSSSNKYAMSAIHILVNSLNAKYADFASPSMTSGVNIIMSNQTFDATWQIIYPFGTFVWILIAMAIIVVSLTFTTIDRISKNEANYYSVATMFSYTYASFTQAALDITPKRLSARTLSMFMWFTVMLLLSSYTSSQAVVLLTPPSEGCVNSLSKILTCGAVFNIPPLSGANNMLKDPLYSNLSANRKFTETFWNVSQYFNTDNDYSSYKLFAHVGDTLFNRYYYSQTCNYMNISLIGQPQYIQFRSFAVPIGAKYVLTINNNLLNITTSGEKTTILNNWFPDPPTQCSFSTHAKQLSYSDIAGLYIVLAVGIGLSILAGVVEEVSRRFRFKKLKSMAPQLEFGQVYEALVVKTKLEGVYVDIKAQPETFFVPYENLNPGNIELKFPHELQIRDGTILYLKYFGCENKTKKARLVLVQIQPNTQREALHH